MRWLGWVSKGSGSLILLLGNMYCMLGLDLGPTTNRRSARFILAVISPLLSPVCGMNINRTPRLDGSLTNRKCRGSILQFTTWTLDGSVSWKKAAQTGGKRGTFTRFAISRCFSAKSIACSWFPRAVWAFPKLQYALPSPTLQWGRS